MMGKVYVAVGEVHADVLILKVSLYTHYYSYHIVRLPIMPDHWCDKADEKRMRFSISTESRCYDTEQVLATKWKFDHRKPNLEIDIDGTAALTTFFESAQEDPYYPIGREMKKFSTDEAPRFTVLECESSCEDDAGADDVRIYGHFVEAVHDDAYDGEAIEQLSRNANKLYAPDYPISAWHAMRAICETYNKMLYETRPVRTFIFHHVGSYG